MMNVRNTTLLAAFAATTLGATNAQAAITLYTDRATFLSDLGTPGFTEDFESFTADTQFRTVPVTVMGGSFSQEGVNPSGFRNFIDVVPLVNSDGNGTNAASLYTNRAEGANPGTFVRFTFDSLNQAFGFNSYNANGVEGAVLEVYNGTTLLGSVALTNASGAFAGYILDEGDVATSVRLRSRTLSAGSTGEGFFIDNLVGTASPVPEPGALAAIGMGLAGLIARRRKRA